MNLNDTLAQQLRKRAEIRLKSTCRGEDDRLAKQLIIAADRIEQLEKRNKELERLIRLYASDDDDEHV